MQDGCYIPSFPNIKKITRYPNVRDVYLKDTPTEKCNIKKCGKKTLG